MKKVSEKEIHTDVCKYLDAKYPDVIYLSDASGIRVTVGLQMEMKRKRCKRYKIPDLIILHPNKTYKGLVIEIKTDLSKIVNKSGDIRKNIHVKEQLKTLERLQELGYAGVFGCGFDHIKSLLDEYFKP
jgi:hypothetical protein